MRTSDQFKVDIPEGKAGPWVVKRFHVTKADADLESLRAAFSGRGRAVPEGTYTGLFRGGAVIMSDTPDEIRDHLIAIRMAKDECLIFGLGIGMVARAMLEKPEVTKVTVIELSPDVITLTAPSLKTKYGARFEIIEGDALTWKPPKGARFGCVWADIWDNITSDNLKEMSTFNRRYARNSEWKGCWAEGLCRHQRSGGW